MKKEKQMIAKLQSKFESVKESVETLASEIRVINENAESVAIQISTEDAIKKLECVSTDVQDAFNILVGSKDEPSMSDVFYKTNETLQELTEYVSDEYSSTDDTRMMVELDDAKNLIADATEILQRARLKAEGQLKGSKTSRVVLKAMGEYFTIDPTTPELRYTGIPEDYRK